jgi:hypothetical protein
MLRDIDAGQARSRLELSQALIWVANLGKPHNAGTVDLLKVEKRLAFLVDTTMSFVLSVTLNRARDYSSLSRRHLRLMDEGERIEKRERRKEGRPSEVLRVHDVW